MSANTAPGSNLIDSSSDVTVEVSALAINVVVPEDLRWTDTRRGEEFLLSTLNVRLLPDGSWRKVPTVVGINTHEALQDRARQRNRRQEADVVRARGAE